MNKNPVMQMLFASKEVLSKRKYLTLFAAFSLVVVFVFVYIPVTTIPGNSYGFQLSIFTPANFILMGILALLTGLLFTMSIYVLRQSAMVKEAGRAGAGGGAGVTAAIFGTAACSSCVAAIFGFLGAPTVFFLIGARNYIVTGAIILLIISLYFTSKNVNKICEECVVSSNKTKHENK